MEHLFYLEYYDNFIYIQKIIIKKTRILLLYISCGETSANYLFYTFFSSLFQYLTQLHLTDILYFIIF